MTDPDSTDKTSTDKTSTDPTSTDPTSSYPQPNLYQSVPVRQTQPKPPLQPRQKSGARLAGIVSFLMLSLGYMLLGIPLAILTIIAVVTLFFQVAGRASGEADWYRQLLVYADRLQPAQLVIPLVIFAVVGAALMVASLFVSARILRSHGIVKAWPVTWAGAGIAIVGSWLVGGVLSVPLQLVGGGMGGNMDNDNITAVPLGLVLIGFGFLISIAATAVVGWLSWWWMAHVMRPAAVVTETSEQRTSE